MRRRKRKGKTTLPPAEVNVVSLMDILTSLLFFILMVISFSKYAILDATSLISGEPDERDKKVFSLQVSFLKTKTKCRYNDKQGMHYTTYTDALVELGPTVGLKIVKSSRLKRFLKSNKFSGSAENGYTRLLTKFCDSAKLLSKLRNNFLKNIKKSFPNENKIIIAFNDKVLYQEMIDAMNSMRALLPEDKAFDIVNLAANKTEKTRVLFPQLIVTEDLSRDV